MQKRCLLKRIALLVKLIYLLLVSLAEQTHKGFKIFPGTGTVTGGMKTFGMKYLFSMSSHTPYSDA